MKYYLKPSKILRGFEQSRRRAITFHTGTHYKNQHSAYNVWNRAINRGDFKMTVNVYCDFIIIYKK